MTARAGNRRVAMLSAPRAHTNAPYKRDFYGKRRGRLKPPRAGPDRVVARRSTARVRGKHAA
jgi:hypothetical protein